jgi:hypothetical protein
MTKRGRSARCPDRYALCDVVQKLLEQEKEEEAYYIIGILKTDLAEGGDRAVDPHWPRPGQPAPIGWSIYNAALHWCSGRYRG